jgi:hypothetical protein
MVDLITSRQLHNPLPGMRVSLQHHGIEVFLLCAIFRNSFDGFSVKFNSSVSRESSGSSWEVKL